MWTNFAFTIAGCYVLSMLCQKCVMLCYAMLCYAMLYTLRYDMLCYIYKYVML